MIDQKEYAKIVQATNVAVKQGWDRTKIDWRKAALEIIYELCVSKEKITANDFTGLIKNMPLKTHDNRAIGGLIRIAQKFDWVAKSGQSEVSKAGHLSRIQIWKSLICGKYRVGSGVEYAPPQVDFQRGQRTFVDLGGGKYVVNGTKGKQWRVFYKPEGAQTCECPDYRINKNHACKHIRIIAKYVKEKAATEAIKAQKGLF